MTHFSKLASNMGKILRFGMNRSQNSGAIVRSYWNCKNQINIAAPFKRRILTSVQLENFSNYEKHRKYSRDGKHNIFLLAGGFLLSFFGFGEKEEEKIPELVMSIKRSIYLIQLQEYAKAEQMLHVALRQAQTLQHYNGITYVYDVMANLAMEVKDYKKAEKLFVSVMQRLIQSGTPQEDVKIVHISLKMAKIFEETGQLDKAEQGYQFCLKCMEEQSKNNPENEDVLLLYGMSLDWYAKMLLSQSKFAEALKYMEHAYLLAISVHGRDHEQTVVLLNDLGTISCLSGEHDRALNYLTNAAEIGEKLPEMVNLGSVHVNLGSVYMKKGLFEEAKKSCEKGKAIAKLRNDEECFDDANECLDEIKKFLLS